MTGRPPGMRGREPQGIDARQRAHACPVEDCPTLVSEGHVACREHWLRVPKATREALAEAFVSGDPQRQYTAAQVAHEAIVSAALGVSA